MIFYAIYRFREMFSSFLMLLVLSVFFFFFQFLFAAPRAISQGTVGDLEKLAYLLDVIFC